MIMMIVNCDSNLKMVTDEDNAECDSDENSE